jgi:hypothetical protein
LIFKFYKAVESEAWRGFCRHGTIFLACWRDRGTKLLSGRKLVTVQEFGKWAVVQYRGTILIGAGN